VPDVRPLPRPSFGEDDGSADTALADALSAYRRDRRASPVLAALCRSRLLVAMLAVPEGETASDETADSRGAVAVALMQGRDGRTALLGFTSLASMLAWRPAARPVPTPAPDAARSALAQGADAVVLDVAGPVTFVLEGEPLRHLAAGHVLTRTDLGFAWLAAAAG